MIISKEQSHLFIQDATAFLYTTDVNTIINEKAIIDENILNDKIVVLAVIWNSHHIPINIDQNQKVELYQWLNSLPILTIIIVDTQCCGDLLQLIMMFDIRLGGNSLSLQFPGDDSNFVFDFEERCQLLIGNEENINGYRFLFNKTLHLDDIYFQRMINQVIDIDDVQNEVQKYIIKIIGKKENYHIKSIIKCFNNYKLLGLNTDRELLLEEETKQFCILTVKSHQNGGRI